jgi:septum formation topological specificity factor MinE
VKKIFARERRPEDLPAYAPALEAAILEIIKRRPPEA